LRTTWNTYAPPFPFTGAKRVLLAHPDWSSEAVADYCGFNSRENYHRIFKEQQGMTPAQYQEQQAAEVSSSRL
jgi:AraC-like DNA-binding protein